MAAWCWPSVSSLSMACRIRLTRLPYKAKYLIDNTIKFSFSSRIYSRPSIVLFWLHRPQLAWSAELLWCRFLGILVPGVVLPLNFEPHPPPSDSFSWYEICMFQWLEDSLELLVIFLWSSETLPLHWIYNQRSFILTCAMHSCQQAIHLSTYSLNT